MGTTAGFGALLAELYPAELRGAAMGATYNLARTAQLATPVVERLRTVVAEATMNAIEHGNQGRLDVPVDVEVAAAGGVLTVRITDEGLGGPITDEAETPDLDLKLQGVQKPRGWGLFLIENMVDEIRVSDAGGRHTVELVVNLEGGSTDGDS